MELKYRIKSILIEKMSKFTVYLKAVLWIRIRMFLGSRIRISHSLYGSESGYGSGSCSFSQEAKKSDIKHLLVPTVLFLINDILYLKTDVNIPSKSMKQKQL
jgi:hypothetical protein